MNKKRKFILAALIGTLLLVFFAGKQLLKTRSRADFINDWAVAFESESGNPSGTVFTSADQQASGGQYVWFGPEISPTPPVSPTTAPPTPTARPGASPTATSAPITPPAGCLVKVIDASKWLPPSPDTSGMVFIPSSNRYLVVDCEVDEIPAYFTGKNIFEITVAGNVTATYTTQPWSNEPTGVSVNPANGHLFFSDDDRKIITEVALGSDGIFGTADDTKKSISTSAFGGTDPEGVSFAKNELFIADGVGNKIFRLNPGANGIFEGVAPAGDDTVTSFNTSTAGITDPEGVAFNADTNSLYLVSTKNKLVRVSLTGQLLQTFNIVSIGSKAASDVAYGPSSYNPSVKSVYITDRAVDNGTNPNENDGKIFEINPAACL